MEDGIRIVSIAEQRSVSGRSIVNHVGIPSNVQVEDRSGTTQQIEAFIPVTEVNGNIDGKGLTRSERRIKRARGVRIGSGVGKHTERFAAGIHITARVAGAESRGISDKETGGACTRWCRYILP